MKYFVCISLFLLTTYVSAQVEHAPTVAPQDEMLEIEGIQVRLGMDQNTVAEKLRERKMLISDISSYAQARSSRAGATVWLLCAPGHQNCEPQVGQVTFRNGHVVTVVKNWTSTENAAEAFAALYVAAKDLEKRGFGHCQLTTREC